ncbi:MAG: Type 1 glutamine amidotransferase-like domain-containing protein [Beduini sp.]|uniref:Type 1 glutamine amidotransferase-like domain-containing protein n=1 Tax=Beduini sp. TaxID=1922300 RepID=UPI0011C9BA6A
MINILHMENISAEPWCFETFKNYIHPTDKVLIIPFSFKRDEVQSQQDFDALYHPDYGKYYALIMNGFHSYGIPASHIYWINYFSTDDKTNAKQLIREADIIYFTGGLPDQLKDRLIEFDLIDSLQRFNGLIMGFSAGAMIQLHRVHMTPDDDYDHYFYMNGLDILHGFDIECHFENTPVQQNAIKKAINDYHLPVYGIGDKGAIIVEDGQLTCIGDVHQFI